MKYLAAIITILYLSVEVATSKVSMENETTCSKVEWCMGNKR